MSVRGDVSASARQPEEKRDDDGAPGWLDAVSFAVGLGLAWQQGWKTADLVWSLWLSSLVVGYAMIVWSIAGPFFVRQPDEQALSLVRTALLLGIRSSAVLFLLAFFTVHYAGFHFGHSLFLTVFFPLVPDDGVPPWNTYALVWSRYWIWLPVAFLAERAAFRRPGSTVPRAGDTAATPKSIRHRKTKAAAATGPSMMAPYKNVIRMHLLIFFFAGAHYAGLENFAVYAVVYALYFCPWRWLWRNVVSSRAARS